MPAATRIGDKDVVDCVYIFRMRGSPDVSVNGRAWSRQYDPNNPHPTVLKACLGNHSGDAVIIIGSKTVFVNSRGAGRLGDLLGVVKEILPKGQMPEVIEPCTMVEQGSPDVNCGG